MRAGFQRRITLSRRSSEIIPFRRLMGLLSVIAGVIALAHPFGRAPTANAQIPAPPPPKALSLPASTFPRGAAVHGAGVSNHVADATSKLHVAAFDQLARVDGYLETATWTPKTKYRSQAHPMTIEYLTSRFATADQAAAAYGDAEATLWEYGKPSSSRIVDGLIFTVGERDRHGDGYVIQQQGPVETELRLRFDSRTDPLSVNTGLWYLRHAAQIADSLTRRFVGALPPPPAPGGEAVPEVYVSPWGTGPVVKSPSLMTLDAPQFEATAAMTENPGAFRSVGGPALASRASAPVAIVPTDVLSRFVQTGTLEVGALYEATTLYGDQTGATQAFEALSSANRARKGIRPYHLPLNPPSASRPTTVDAVQAWQASGERVVAARTQNVVLILAGTSQGWDSLASLADKLVSTVPTWLHAQGTSLVDGSGNSARPACLNWYGAEQQDFVVGGLDFRSYESILQEIKQLGYTCIRLPFSNQLVEQDPVVTTHLKANPELAGLHALDILDHIVNYAGALGLSAVLDDHRSEAGWSAEENGLWYTPDYPDAAFTNDWVTLAQRYVVNNVVVGVDLRNEPHGTATWGDGNPATDWLAASERAGNAVLAVNPHLLILVEGIQSYGTSGSYWWGGNLMGVATAPVVLHFEDGSSARSQLVYSPHDYGPDNCSGGCPWFNTSTTYDSLAQLWQQHWGYITANPDAPYAAPVWIGEFGTCNYQQSCVSDTAPGSQGQWFSSLVRFIAQNHLSWAYWSANGTESTGGERVYGTQDWYGFFTADWTTPNPWIQQALQTIES